MRQEDQKSVYGTNHPVDGNLDHMEKDGANAAQEGQDGARDGSGEKRERKDSPTHGHFERATAEMVETPRD